MPGLVPGIHVLTSIAARKTWMAGTSPAMTKKKRGNAARLEHDANGCGAKIPSEMRFF
jgi:hypothetical protein